MRIVPLVLILAFIVGPPIVAIVMLERAPAIVDELTPDNSIPPPPAIASAEPAPDLDAVFQNHEPWIGGDGVYTVALAKDHILWLFSDTWIGKIKDGKRTDATIVNNTVGVQKGIGANSSLTLFAGRGNDGKPQAVIKPDDNRGWFWLQAGAFLNSRLYIFLAQIEKTKDTSAFGFRGIGQQLAVVSNPLDAPGAWSVKQVPLPFTMFSPKRDLVFGAATLVEGEFLYVYGVDEEITSFGRRKRMVLARVPTDAVEDGDAWRFYHEGQWQSDFKAVTHLADGVANEYAVWFDATRKLYFTVYTENSLSPRILARSARRPWGPWSEPALVYQCPQMAADARVFTYAGKGHPELSTSDEWVISYVVNSYDFWHVAADARLYWPRFVRVKLK